MEQYDDTFIVIDELGNEKEAIIIMTFDSEEFNKSYVVYQMKDDEDEEYYAASFDPDEGNEGNLIPIETDEEWDFVEEVLESFLEEEDESVEDTKDE